MKQSQLFAHTRREVPKDEESANARLLTRAGFVHKEMAGVYTLLPLGLRVVKNIEAIVRKEMDALGAQEILMPSLQPKANWDQTKRWNSFDALFKLKSPVSKNEYALGPTHEEIVVPLLKQYVSSYRDLPQAVFQIQTKFRDEKRAKSGLLRTREFLMKDLYSFHATESDFEQYYEHAKKAYQKIFQTIGLKAVETQAGGGAFSEFSHEYQVITEAGEDEIIYCPGGDFSANAEISKVKEGKQCDMGHGPLKKAKAVEVGNIFPLKTKFSDAFDFTYKSEDGTSHPVIMGCYGIGITRIFGVLAEVFHDEQGLAWPQSVAPALSHLIALQGGEKESEQLYADLQKQNIAVLYDDRVDVRAGEKFADADLIGIPLRIVASEKTLSQNSVEIKYRNKKEVRLVKTSEALALLKTYGSEK